MLVPSVSELLAIVKEDGLVVEEQ